MNKSTFTAKGAYGELRKGYKTVASLRDWTWDGGGRVHARAADILDAFWFEQGGLSLRLQFGPKWWTWNEVQPHLVQGSCAVDVDGKPVLKG